MTQMFLLLCALGSGAMAADWPMWRYDEMRCATSPDALAEELHLQWVRELPEPMRAWPFQYDDAGKLDFDVSYEPVAAGTTLLVGSNVSDSVTAYDTRSGSELWRFYTNGPVRFAPVIHQGRVYAGSDDGWLYCLDIANGSLLWSFHAAPRDRYLMGNARMVNTWAVRGGPVIRDNTVYLAAGVFPFMGTFIYALDATTGEVTWANTGNGSMYNRHQHGGAFAFGGVAPQGYLVATEELLLIPGGRTAPAVFDRATGELVYFRQANEMVGKGPGGFGVWAHGEWFHNPNTAARHMYAVADGAQLGEMPADVATDDLMVGFVGDELVGTSGVPEVQEVEITDRLGQGAIKQMYEFTELFRTDLGLDLSKVHLRAGNRIYAGSPDGVIAAIDLPEGDGEPRVSWQARVEGTPWSMIAADDRLFVVTEDGDLFCFGPAEAQAARHRADGAIDRPQDVWTRRAAAMLDEVDRTGFALVLGVGSGRLIEELLAQSELHVITIDPDATRVERMRRRLDDAGYYGRRAAVIHADPTRAEMPPCFAGLVTAENLSALNINPDGYAWEGTARRIYEMLRPYGGMIALPLSDEEQQAIAEWAVVSGVAGARVGRVADFTTITREGPLPGAGQWTHQYADAANSGLSRDSIVRAPLGLLWYGGGYNNHNALPRHQNGPVPHVVGGRLVILGVDTMTARDVYTGRELWVTSLPGVGHAFTSLEHEEQLAAGGHPYFPNQPGANFVGSNYVSVEDGVYVGYQGGCVRLDPVTGEKLSEFRLTAPDGGDSEISWGFAVYDDLLITGADPQMFDDTPIGDENSWNATSSDRLVVLDRYSGEVLWQLDARIGFRHNALIAAAGKVFVIDGLSDTQLEMLERRGERPDEPPRLMALDARTGDVVWVRDADTFGTWLGYSADHDLLIQSGRHGARVPLPDEPRERMLAHSGATGEVLWERSATYSGPIALHLDQIITGRGQPAIDLRTGENIVRLHPLTGLEIARTFTRSYGCGTQNVAENIITFRSAAAGYYDLARDGGTGNFGGTKAGCTNSMVVGDGVLNAPEYTRSCFCSYQLQTSYGLVHMPDAEMWTYTDVDRGAGVVRRAGINFGAPGSRLDDAGTWWMEYPPSGASALKLPIAMSPAADEDDAPQPFVHHASWVERSGGMPWVSASGLVGAMELTIGLAADGDEPEERGYTVRLHFVEPGEAAVGERLFSVRLQDQEVITGLDVARETGGAARSHVREITGVRIRDALRLALVPAPNSQHPPVLCGIELVLEDTALADAGAN